VCFPARCSGPPALAPYHPRTALVWACSVMCVRCALEPAATWACQPPSPLSHACTCTRMLSANAGAGASTLSTSASGYSLMGCAHVQSIAAAAARGSRLGAVLVWRQAQPGTHVVVQFCGGPMMLSPPLLYHILLYIALMSNMVIITDATKKQKRTLGCYIAPYSTNSTVLWEV
jgi:hypothetical protein